VWKFLHFSRAHPGVDCINVSSSRGTRHQINFRFLSNIDLETRESFVNEKLEEEYLEVFKVV
jgi:hypothetical protein